MIAAADALVLLADIRAAHRTGALHRVRVELVAALSRLLAEVHATMPADELEPALAKVFASSFKRHQHGGLTAQIIGVKALAARLLADLNRLAVAVPEEAQRIRRSLVVTLTAAEDGAALALGAPSDPATLRDPRAVRS